MHAKRIHPARYALERWCNGPSHDAPELLPISRFHRRGRVGGGTRECAKCSRQILSAGVPNLGWVPADSVRPYVLRLHRFYGTGEHPSIPVSAGCFYNILAGRTKFVRRSVAARIVLAAHSVPSSSFRSAQDLVSASCAFPSCPLEAAENGMCSYHARQPADDVPYAHADP
jgi:hypothetical protein